MNRPRIEVSRSLVRYGDVVAVNGVSFTSRRGEHVTLLGPSGCGKTTTLRAIAGLEQPSGGSIRIDGHTVYSAGERRNVPTEKRGVSMVFQSYADLAAHDGVRQCRLRSARAQAARSRDPAERRARARPGADAAARRPPASKLSGGQQQRVALARAIAFSPTVVLFDEPLSNLDAKLRAEMRVELRELQRRLDITSVYVTHDQEEALAISDRVIVMNGGVIEQIGTPEDIYNRPRSRFVADFVGSANLIAGNCARPLGCERHADLRCGRRRAAGGCCVECVARAEHRCAAHVLYPSGAHAGIAQRRPWPYPSPHVPRRLHPVRGGLRPGVDLSPPTELFEEGSEVTVSFSPVHCVLL